MKKILLCSINARYIHTNLAIRSIKRYIQEYVPEAETETAEWTVNQSADQILREAVEKRPAVLLFSVYIWNVSFTFRLIRELRKLLPDTIIGTGGPEVSYRAEEVLNEERGIDFILSGEGEKTAAEFAAAWLGAERDSDTSGTADTCSDGVTGLRGVNRVSGFSGLEGIKGIWYRDGGGTPRFTGQREPISDLSTVPFPYTAPDGSDCSGVDPEHQIIYYESARGCPFRCSYCLSSIDKSVRYFPLERVLRDLSFFLRGGYRLVKFVDRTFNLDPARYLRIWQYIIDNWNGVTTFHFEMSARLLSTEALELLTSAPAGAIQFEIGIQSTNAAVLAGIGRNADFEEESRLIRRIPNNIHVHLDLIAGLPDEDLASCRRSFDQTIALKPQMLQQGFLKILSGTAMERTATTEGFLYQDEPPYETLATPSLAFRDICVIKDVELMTDVFYNSGCFREVMNAIIDGNAGTDCAAQGPFEFFRFLTRRITAENSVYLPRKMRDYFALLAEVFADNSSMIERLRFDFMCMAKPGHYPEWFTRRYDKAAHDSALRTHTDVRSVRESYARSDWELFSINPLTGEERESAFLFLYADGSMRKGTNDGTSGNLNGATSSGSGKTRIIEVTEG